MSVDHDAGWQKTQRPTIVFQHGASDVSICDGRPFQGWTCGGGRQQLRRQRILGVRDHGITFLLVILLVTLASPAYAALLNFENCLDASVVESRPLQLQFVPLDVSVVFDSQDPLNSLNVTVYGNVSGTADRSSTYPSPSDPQWSNPDDIVGKIVDLNTANNKYTTLLTNIDVVTFSPYNEAFRFCDTVTQACPMAPVFFANASDLSALRSFSIQHDMQSTYRFSTLSSTFRIRSGDAAATELGCITVDITPDLGTSLRNTLAYVPLVVLLLVGLATISAAIYSPWGTTNLLHWTSNYGRDEDVLRLVTPGFGDCLQYIQFAVLTGALSLNYPGYYQPVVSQVAWSVLMFNQSFVHPSQGRDPVVDGVYAVNGTYGLDRLDQLVGMASASDIWPGMIIWLLVILGTVTLLIQLAFALRWLHRQLANIPEEDLRSRNMPFTVGNVVRIVFNFLFLPVVSISFFQLVIAGDSPAYSVALAVVVILALLAFSVWTVRLIGRTHPKSHLFDDLPTVLLYGPLYNTFCDDAAAFAAVPIFITFARGVAIGALQPSGIAQIVLLAICEVVYILTLVAFRPFPHPTSMNLYHACFAIVRFLAILLSVVFVPSIGVSQAARGWIGYIILLLHALVLVFGFFLNALQTIIEVIARLAGAGGYEGGATRGGLVKVFGMRQLSRRLPRRDAAGIRQSMASDAVMLAYTDERMSAQFDGSRPRSLSGSNAMLLNRATASDGRGSAVFESGSAHGGTHSRANSSGLYTPTTLGGFQSAGYQTPGSNSPRSGPLHTIQPHDPYYRPPRPRRNTDRGTSLEKGRGASRTVSRSGNLGDADDDLIEGPSVSGRGTPLPAYIPAPKDDLEYDDPRQSRKDYAVREVDFYYRVRAPLSQSGTRKLKTGPADPTGPVSSATGFFRNLFRGKTKEKGKGFEVVRSARAQTPGLFPEGDNFNEPYRDEPDGQSPPRHERGAEDTDANDSDEGVNAEPERPSISLPQLDIGGAIELPSRLGSRRNSQEPSVARQSSQRQDSVGSLNQDAEDQSQPAPLVEEGVSAKSNNSHPQNEPTGLHSDRLQPSSGTGRLPFSANSSLSRDRNLSMASTAASTSSSRRAGNDSNPRPSSVGYVAQHRTSDYIHEASPDEPSFTESAAELVDAAPQHGGATR